MTRLTSLLLSALLVSLSALLASAEVQAPAVGSNPGLVRRHKGKGSHGGHGSGDSTGGGSGGGSGYGSGAPGGGSGVGSHGASGSGDLSKKGGKDSMGCDLISPGWSMTITSKLKSCYTLNDNIDLTWTVSKEANGGWTSTALDFQLSWGPADEYLNFFAKDKGLEKHCAGDLKASLPLSGHQTKIPTNLGPSAFEIDIIGYDSQTPPAFAQTTGFVVREDCSKA